MALSPTQVNGRFHPVEADPATPLTWILRVRPQPLLPSGFA